MRSFLFAVMALISFSAASAQRFYYVETNNLVDQLLKSGLKNSDQYVVPSVMASEYTIRTNVGSSDNQELNLEIILADSVTQKEIFRSTEQFCFTTGNRQPELLYGLAIRSFLQRRIGELISASRQNHTSPFARELRARKDKT